MNLEPLYAQVPTLTQLLSQLIQYNWARKFPTAGPRTHRTQPEPSPGNEVETSGACQEQLSGVWDSRPTVGDIWNVSTTNNKLKSAKQQSGPSDVNRLYKNLTSSVICSNIKLLFDRPILRETFSHPVLPYL